ncbi:MAG: cobalamin biosynthesis protein CobQ [Oscillospiraceae bacterium]|nr:cobalamin biosynthesis protein CobQ [Oscillospiraceae bacterium]
MYIKNETVSNSRLTIVTGHYGAGKTNFAVNLALYLKENARDDLITIADLDIVNPYFRTADFKKLFADSGIRLAVSDFANGSLDVPALNLDMRAALSQSERLIIDVGGDPEGARVLGRFSPIIRQFDYEMIYVINCRRYLTETAGQAVALMREIEKSSGGLRVTKLFNNSHLGKETTKEVIEESIPFAEEVSRLTGLPLLEFPVKVYVKPIWEL